MYSSVSSQCKTYGNLFSLAKTFVKIQYSVCVCNQILKMHCFHEISAKKCWESQCGNYGNLLTNFFGKNFVNITVLLERLRRDSFSKCSAFTKFFTKFRQINVFTRILAIFLTKIPWNRCFIQKDYTALGVPVFW